MFRTGGRTNAVAELARGLRQAMGSGISQEPLSNAGVEAWAFARSLDALYEAIASFSNQSTPLTVTYFLERWEALLGIVPPAGATNLQRRQRIDLLFRRWTTPPTQTNVLGYLGELLGNLFIKTFHLRSSIEIDAFSHTIGTTPGGLTIPGGVNQLDGPWQSPIAMVPVRVWNPRDADGSETYGLAEWLDMVNKFSLDLDSYLPAPTTFHWYRHQEDHVGTLSASVGDIEIHGIGTDWISGPAPLLPGNILEVVTDDGTRVDLVIDEAVSNTLARLTVAPTKTITERKYRRMGIFLDSGMNLDFAAFSE